MRVILAGYNLDQEIITRLRESFHHLASAPDRETIDPSALTPETLSAAYARISRDPAPIPELRARAMGDVANARRSNQRIVFGFGHASVAEHAVFNLDILDVSRLAIEALEMTRLGSSATASFPPKLPERHWRRISGNCLAVNRRATDRPIGCSRTTTSAPVPRRGLHRVPVACWRAPPKRMPAIFSGWQPPGSWAPH